MSKRQKTVQVWANHCGYPDALDVSARWYSCVAAHVVIGDRPLRGVAEMLSTHYLLIDDDGEVIFDAEIGETISVERRQEVAVGESLGGDSAPVVRTYIDLVVRSKGIDDGSREQRNPKTQNGPPASRKKKHSGLDPHEDNVFSETSTPPPFVSNATAGERPKGLITNEAEERADSSVFDARRDVSTSPNYKISNASNDTPASTAATTNSLKAIPITFVLEGPEGAHFASGMELLWRRKFRMLSLRDQAMCRCSNISDFIYTISMLPFDVDCVFQQLQYPPNYSGNNMSSSGHFGDASPNSFTSGAGNPYSATSGMTVTIDKSAVLRIDQNYVVQIIYRPENIYDSLAGTNISNNALSSGNKLGAASGGSPNSPTLGGSNAALASGSTTLSQMNAQLSTMKPFHLNDVLLITHNENQLRMVLSDGRVLLLGSVDAVRTGPEQRPVTGDAIGSGGSPASASSISGAQSANTLAMERRKAEAQATKAATGIDIAAMTAGARNVLDIFLLFVSTSCYQQLYLTARGITKPNVSRGSGGQSLASSRNQRTANAFDSPDFETTPQIALLMPPVIPPAACFSSNDLYRVYHHYCSIDTNLDGTLSPVELFTAIGPVLVDNEGTLPLALLKTFDVCKKGSIQLAEYFYGCRVLLRGTVKDRLLYVFALFDTESKGTIVLNEFVNGLRLLLASAHAQGVGNNTKSNSNFRKSFFGGGASSQSNATGGVRAGSPAMSLPVLGGGKNYDSVDAFGKELFTMIDTNNDGEIDVEEFCRAMTLNPSVIFALRKISSVEEERNGTASAAGSSTTLSSSSNGGSSSPINSASLANASNPNTIVTFGHPRWREMVQILAGIEHGCRHPEAAKMVDPKTSFGIKVPHDCSAWGNHALAGEVALRTMANIAINNGINNSGAFTQLLNNPPSSVIHSTSTETITFNDYAPAVFRTIRTAFGISNEEYLSSIGISQLRSGLLFGSISCLYEMISSGRSGSFFYSTHDNKYILKTIPMGESVILRKILFDYYTHVIKYPNTLLTRFCGLHALIRNGRKLIFVVMQNIFLNKVPVHESYDLKGSTVGRSTPLALRSPGVALKDNDFGARKLYIRSEIKQKLIKQIQLDSALLAKHNLNDYSFLLGVHTSFDGPLDKRKSPPCPSPSHNLFQQFYGGIECAALIDPSKEATRKEVAAMYDINNLVVTEDKEDTWEYVDMAKDRPGIVPLSTVRYGSGTNSPNGPDSPTNNNSLLPAYPKQATPLPTDPSRPLRYEIYFVGIIDMLTDYGMKKRGEHYSKSIIYDSKQVSCIAPQEYLVRYIEYLDSIMVAID